MLISFGVFMSLTWSVFLSCLEVDTFVRDTKYFSFLNLLIDLVDTFVETHIEGFQGLDWLLYYVV